MVHVQDTGAGLANDDFKKLFTRFGKLQRTASMNADGLGLGLTIVRQIIRQFKGQIRVISHGVDRGTLFIVSMKMLTADVASDPSESAEILAE